MAAKLAEGDTVATRGEHLTLIAKGTKARRRKPLYDEAD